MSGGSPLDRLSDITQYSGTLSSLRKQTYRIALLGGLVILLLVIFYQRSELIKATQHDTLGRLSSPIQLADNAHKFNNADDFWPHFKNVISIAPLSMKEAKSGCTWTEDEDVNFNFGDGGSGLFLDLSWVKKDMQDQDLDESRSMWQRALMEQLVPYQEVADRFHGRGIVIVSGDGRSLKRMRVIFQQLKRLGCTMPIEIHFWGKEMSPEVQNEIKKLWTTGALYFNDLSSPENIKSSSYYAEFSNHYHLKTAAVVNSRFAEPLLLDSDNIPVLDPETLYESSVYKEYGTIFWPDISRTRTNNPMWPITNTVCRMDEYEQESGQLLVDKRKFWYHLQLAAWLIDAPENEGRFQSWILGDKDCFRFAWHALKTKYGSPSRWVTSIGSLNDGFYCGHTFAQHHPDPDGQIAFMHGGLLKTIPHSVLQQQLDLKGGVFQAYKRSPADQKPRENTHVEIGWDNFEYMSAEEKPGDEMTPASCVHFSQVEPRPLEEILPGFQKTFQEIGGYWMLDDTEDCMHNRQGCSNIDS